MIIDRVGAGGMGVVYGAYDPELDRRVALKLLRDPGDDARDQWQTSLLREARAMARLSHPNVLSVYDVGTLDGHGFFTMEFVRGGTLRAWLGQRPRSVREILSLLVGAARGLAAAHAAGIVYRDFKPDNVMSTSPTPTCTKAASPKPRPSGAGATRRSFELTGPTACCAPVR
jgi:serine/threonine protein kinase